MKLLRMRPGVGQIHRDGSAVETCLLPEAGGFAVDLAGVGLLEAGGVVFAVVVTGGLLGGGAERVSAVRSFTAGRALGISALLAGVLAVTKPKLLPLAALPIVKPTWKSIRYKLRHEQSPAKYVYLPAARLTATTSNLAGFLVGRYFGE